MVTTARVRRGSWSWSWAVAAGVILSGCLAGCSGSGASSKGPAGAQAGAGGSPSGGSGGGGSGGSGGARAGGGNGGSASGAAGGQSGSPGAGGSDATPGPDGSSLPAPDAAPGADAGPADGSAPDARPPWMGVAKIMVLGSSNEIRTCWRAFLWQKLRAAGVTNFDFVGGQQDGPACGVPGYDRHDESRSGTIVSDITAGEFARRFGANPPDVVLVHFGGADLLRGLPPETVMPGYTLMVTEARKVNPKVIFLVGEHTPMEPANCPRCPMTVPELNAAIVAWAKEISTPESLVQSVDLFTGVDVATDTSDRVHLNDAGSQKVSDRFFEALLPLFKP